MQRVIYLDVFFALNFLMDFFLLIITRKILNIHKELSRCILSAITGSVYACVVITAQMTYNIAEMFFTYIIIAGLMIIIAFGYNKLMDLLKNIIMLYAVTFLMCGVINAAYYRTQFGTILDYVTQKGFFSDLSIAVLLTFAIIGAGIIRTVLLVFKYIIQRNRFFYNAELSNNGINIYVKALMDTGNSLCEPISGKPVSVVNYEKIAQIIEKDINTAEKFKAVPYHSVGKKAGIMKGYQIDYMKITGDMDTYRIEKPIVAVYEGELSSKGEYEMLLNEKLMKNWKYISNQ